MTAFAEAQESESEEVVVSATRLPDAATVAPFAVDVLEAPQLRRAPELRLDDILRNQVAGFSLFRRSSSRTANPTTQGVTLRNFGPSGAGRTLVLLDGIPLNDPFAGYVLWSQVPTSSIDSVIVQPGGGAGLFGNSALAGTIYLTSRNIEETTALGEASVGDRDTYELSLAASVVERPVAIEAFAERFSTGGYPLIARHQRGSVDTNADAESDLFSIRGEWEIDRNTSLRVSARHFDDDRGNGTTLTHNETTGDDLSAAFNERFPTLQAALQLSAYLQERQFSSTFSSINATRTVETPSLDQFDVPADAAGGAAVWSMSAGANNKLTLGADTRWVEGETNEAFRWNGTEFTRLRNAGGEQFFIGAFAEDTWSVLPSTTIVGGVRYDHWELFDGFRKETERTTGVTITDSHFADRDGDEVNGRIGARVDVSQAVAIRGAIYTGFRVPTLNELYRPFRVGNDVTEANPGLKPEHVLGAEFGSEWQATKTFRVSGTGFVNRLEDAVTNVTIGVGPGTFNPGGFIPAGGVLRQRQNVDLVVAPGFEGKAEWQVLPRLRLRGSYIFTHPTIERAADSSLEHKLLAQTPEHVFTAGVDWNPAAKWAATAQFRYNDRQFEDDQNSRVLAPFTAVDAAVMFEFSARMSAALRAENLFNTQIQTGKSADGLISIGALRTVSLQLRWQL